MLKIYTSEDIGRFKFYKTGGKFMKLTVNLTFWIFPRFLPHLEALWIQLKIHGYNSLTIACDGDVNSLNNFQCSKKVALISWWTWVKWKPLCLLYLLGRLRAESWTHSRWAIYIHCGLHERIPKLDQQYKQKRDQSKSVESRNLERFQLADLAYYNYGFSYAGI